ncbi:MAG TPA: methyltransferase domain-containing protein [Gemmatimonadaceae bacterium]
MTVPRVRHYDANYDRFSTDLYARIRREAFGEDIGQNSWLTADEHDLFIHWMSLTAASRALDIACGSGVTTLRVAERTGCAVVGIDMHGSAVAEGRAAAERAGLQSRARFEKGDASRPLPFDDASFDAVLCIDAINHLPDRPAVLAEWARVLKPAGVLVFTDPIVVTGPLTGEEMSVRSSIGFFLFVPPGTDERMLSGAGFDVTDVVDRTENMAVTARRRREARDRYGDDLRRIEGDETFEGQQRFLDVAARLAAEGRLSRFAFRAVRR